MRPNRLLLIPQRDANTAARMKIYNAKLLCCVFNPVSSMEGPAIPPANNALHLAVLNYKYTMYQTQFTNTSAGRMWFKMLPKYKSTDFRNGQCGWWWDVKIILSFDRHSMKQLVVTSFQLLHDQLESSLSLWDIYQMCHITVSYLLYEFIQIMHQNSMKDLA